MFVTSRKAWKKLVEARIAGGSAGDARRRSGALRRGPSAAIIERLEDRALLTDLTPPVVVSATPLDDSGGASFSSVRVQFDEAIAAASATNAQNYRLVKADGSFVTVTAAVMDASDATGKTVRLSFAAQSAGESYNVHVGAVADLSGNANPPIGRSYTQIGYAFDSIRSMTTGDFDGDGKLDVVFAPATNTQLSFVKGLGGGSFAAPTIAIAESGTRIDLATADIDGDGRLDVVAHDSAVLGISSIGVVVYFGNGDGTFQAGHARTLAGATEFVVADLDADGDTDLILSNSSGFVTSINPANPRSANPASQATVRAVESWSSVLTVTPSEALDLVVGDVNNDGRPDVVWTRAQQFLPVVYLGTATSGVFAPPVTFPVTEAGHENALIDINGDGRLDFVATGDGSISYGLPGSPYFGSPQATALGAQVRYRYFISPIDLDGDGDLDLLTGVSPPHNPWRPAVESQDPKAYFLYSNGPGVFESTVTTLDLTSLGVKRIKKMEFADVNGDGLPDIIGHDNSSNASSLFVLLSRLGASSATFAFVPNRAPAPSAGGTYTIAEGGSLTLDAGASTDPDGDSLTYTWDVNNDGVFGDAVGVNPTLTWAQLQALGIVDNGMRTIVVRATDPRGWPMTSAATLTITNTPPTLVLSGNATATEGSSYSLSLASSDPGTETITSWTINWGDGTAPEVVSGNPSSRNHTYADNGNYTVTATATDEDGTYAANSFAVAIANIKPTITSTFPESQAGTAPITLTATATDPAGTNDTLTYSWTITRNGVVVTTGTNSSISFTPLVGQYSVTLVVNDEDPGDGTVKTGVIKVRALEDLYGYAGGTWTIGVSTGAAFNTANWGAWGASSAPIATGDFNGDGATDVLRLEGGVLRVGLAGSGSFSNAVWSDLGSGTWSYLSVGDVNGDGRADVMARLDGVWYVSLSTGTGFAAKTAWGAWSPTATWVDIQLVDLNNDGRADLLGRTGLNWYGALSTGTGFGSASVWASWQNLTWDMTATVDVNGDGSADILGRSGSDWYVGVSTGTSFGSVTRWAAWSALVAWADYRVGDFSGDGKTDILARHSSGNWYVATSTGTSFGLASVWGSWSSTANWQDVRVGDFNGDGKADITGRLNGNWYVSTSTGTAFSAGSLWASGWTATYSFIGVGNVYGTSPAGAPLASQSTGAVTGTAAATIRANGQASAKEESLALFWSSAKDDERFAAALLSATRA